MENNSGQAHDQCGSPEHGLHRRRFLEGLGGGVGAISAASWAGLFSNPVFAEQTKRKQKRCILLWLCGGPSQFESWDPKPGRITGGPFKSIPTSLLGYHVSELMPNCAKIMHKLAVVRSMKTDLENHNTAIDLLNRGDKPRPPFVRPTLGSVLGQQLGQLDSPIPNFILLDPCPEGNEFKGFKAGNWAGWLGAEYGPVRLGGQYKLPDVKRLPDITSTDHEEREALRRFIGRKYENDRLSAAASSQNAAFARVKGLMSCADLFDLERLPQKDRDRYGPGTFGLHTLLSRHLVENGAPFVMVANGMPWDSHVFHNEIYQMVIPDLDNIIYQLVTDLEERGMLDDTLVIWGGEFGRTPMVESNPTLNRSKGRDHHPQAFSLWMAGGGVKGGTTLGATDELGFHITDRPVHIHDLQATLLHLLGLDHERLTFHHAGRDYRLTDVHGKVVKEILA